MNRIKSLTATAVLLILSVIAFNAHAQRVIELNKQQFLEKVWDYTTNTDQWKYKGELPCIIDFNAKWCGPCRKMEPILENMAMKYNGKVIIYKVDVDKEQELAALFGITSIPAFLLCPMQGDPKGTTGAYPADEFEQIILTHLLNEEAQ